MHHVITYLLVGVSVWQDDVWGNAVLLKEANAISVELKKKVKNLICLLSTYRSRTCKYTDGEMPSRVYSRRSQQRLTDISFTALTLHISSCFNRAEHTTLPARLPVCSNCLQLNANCRNCFWNYSAQFRWHFQLLPLSNCRPFLYEISLQTAVSRHRRGSAGIGSFSLHDALDVPSDFSGFSRCLCS